MITCKHQACNKVRGEIVKIFCRIARARQVGGRFFDEVNETDCEACQFRDKDVDRGIFTVVQSAGIEEQINIPETLVSGEIVYKRIGWEPPPCPEGYERKSDDPQSDDAWRFVSQWKPCIHRQKKTIPRENCNCATIVQECDLKNGTRVSIAVCRECPLREEENL